MTGDYAVTVAPLGFESEVVRAMDYEAVELDERSFVEQEVVEFRSLLPRSEHRVSPRRVSD